MLSRTKRLSTAEFTVVMEKGRVVHSPLFLVRILKGTKDTKFAAVTPKKVEKTAVGRNKIRRLIYTAIGEILKDMKAASVCRGETSIALARSPLDTISVGTHSIVFAKPVTSLSNQEALVSDLKQLFVKAGILK